MKKNNQKKERDLLEMNSFEVTAVKNPEHRPFLNVFRLEGKNVAQNKLGQVFGVVQIENHSKNSEYIPNLLTQVIKREFFKAPKQETGENFEKALHKANLALTDLAQHEIIEWMGGFNAAIGVVKNDEFHFVQVGRVKVFLLRDKKLSDITPNENQNSITHPIKTFSSISSGKLFPKDKIILIPENALGFLSQKEMERHSKTFTSDEFDNILSSTLQADGDQTGAVVINIKKKKSLAKKDNSSSKKASEKDERVNFFGKTEKEKVTEDAQVEMRKEKIRQQDNFQETLVEQEDMKKLIQEEGDENKSENEDSSAQENNFPQEKHTQNTPPFEEEPEIHIKEKDFPEELERELQAKEELLRPNFFRDTKDKIKEKKNSLCKNFSSLLQEINLVNPFESALKKTTLFTKKGRIFFNKFHSCLKTFFQNFAEKINKRKDSSQNEKIQKEGEGKLHNKESEEKKSSKKDKITAFLSKGLSKEKTKKAFSIKKIKKIIYDKFSTIKKTPGFFLMFWRKIKNISFWNKLEQNLNLSKKRILIAVLFLALLGVIITSTINFLIKPSSHQNQIDQNPKKQIPAKDIGKQLDNLSLIANFQKEIKNSTQMKGDLFLLTENKKIIQFNPSENNQTEIPLPKEIGNPRYLAAIPSLELIFIISEETILSYSPITENFFHNRISLPIKFDNSKGAGTYLTYLYLPNKSDGQIYRYPRSSGGFGNPVKWLEKPIEMEQMADISVSDSIYVAFKNGIVSKFFQGKEVLKASLSKEKFAPFRVKAAVGAKNFFVLDKENGRIVKFDANSGDFLESFADDKFKNSKDFQVDFNQKKLYIIDEENNLLVFEY